MKFGIVLNARLPFDTLKAVQIADQNGFNIAATYDSHFLWQEAWIHYTLWGLHTKRVKIGPFVTNPITRHITVTASLAATLCDITGGRVFIGIGRGDSAVRTMKKKPSSLDDLGGSVQVLRKLIKGQKAQVDGADVYIPWAKWDVPIYIAAYGPKALELAGKVGDGVILQIADPEVIRWSLKWVKKGADEVGRSLDGFEVISAAAWYLSEDLEKAKKETRWFPAMVSNHALDLMRRYPKEELPQSLVIGMEKRGQYDYWEHARKDARHLDFVTDDMIERFGIIGTSERFVERLEELEKAGVTIAVSYTLSEDFIEQTKLIAEKVVFRYQ
jgi:probable F420-dependent oxidoreductase